MTKKKTLVKNRNKKKKTVKVRPAVTVPDLSPLVKETCAVTNPFCPASFTAKWPDNTHFRTTTYSTLGTYLTHVVDASGFGSVLYVGAPFSRYVGTVTGAQCVYTNGQSIGNFPSGTNAWRITSWGLKLSCSGAQSSTTGMVFVRGFSSLKPSTLGTVDGTATTADFARDIPLNRLINKDIFIVSMPLGDMARTFTSYDSGAASVTTLQPLAWQSLNVYTSGAPASSGTLVVTAYYNFELIMNDNDAMVLSATNTGRDNKLVQSTSSNVLASIGNAIEGTAQTVDNIFKSKAFKYLSSAATYAYFGPAAALGTYAANKMIKDVD